MTTELGARYLEHLSDRDLAWLGASTEPAGHDDGDVARELRSLPQRIEPLLGHPDVYRHLFGEAGAGRHRRTEGPARRDRRSEGGDPLTAVSPFLTFAVLVHRCARELEGLPFIREWVGQRRRLPVFDTPTLVAFLDDPEHRLFLAELLGSYSHVASGGVWVEDARGWRRQRFSELDPVGLASLLEIVPEADRPGIYRRLGDLALFLTGLFPDHSAEWGLSSLDAARLRRIVQSDEKPSSHSEDAGSLQLLEELGRRCYRKASETVPAPSTAGARVIARIAERFDQARRILNFMAERHLFAARNRWFPGSSG